MGWVVIGIVVGLVAVDLLIHAVSVMLVLPMFERKPPFGVEPAAADPDAEVVSFPTTHGLMLEGSLYRHANNTGRGLILFCPELDGNHWSAMSYCEGLWDAGFDILAFDFRNQGESDHMTDYEPLHWLTDYEVSDVTAAIAYTRSREDLRNLPLGLLGVSRGGGAALAAAASCHEVESVACQGVFSTETMLLHYALRWSPLYAPQWLLKLVPLWHLKLTLWLTRFVSEIRKGCRYTRLEAKLPRLQRRPVLMIAGESDTYVPPHITDALCWRLGHANQQLWIVPDAKHNMARQVAMDEYDSRLVAHFSKLSAGSHASAMSRTET